LSGEEVQSLTESPMESPVESPVESPIESPTSAPSTSPPTTVPTQFLTFQVQPTISPSIYPTNVPFDAPSVVPTVPSSNEPTIFPSLSPMTFPTLSPSLQPITIQKQDAMMSPDESSHDAPYESPFESPFQSPSLEPTVHPTEGPTVEPTVNPTNTPIHPTSVPPSVSPSVYPSVTPTYRPTTSNLVIDHHVTDDTTTRVSGVLATDPQEDNEQLDLFNSDVNLNDDQHLLHLVVIGFSLAACCCCINCIFVGTYCYRMNKRRNASVIAEQYDVKEVHAVKQHAGIPSSSLHIAPMNRVNRQNHDRRQLDDFSRDLNSVPGTISPDISPLTRLTVDTFMDALQLGGGGAESDASAVGIRYRETNGMLDDEFEIRTSGSESPCNLPEGVQTVPQSEFTGC